ncbi:ATP-binding protein [Nonomuraea maritima]|uniref:ATP-binding protein n=1 Tax=Nonomuraea maritima TaxID=683260 RepID=UPI001FE23B7A|nr:LuxR C-terminal-related transcriptional regulator [Nonomuraea maritima]
MTSFVGRRHEVAEVRQLLSASRMVTLTGTGGVGKTRLALRVGQEVRRAFRDGVWLVELAALTCPSSLVPAVAEALEIRDDCTASRPAALAERLRGKQALIILDNCEHVLDSCAVLVETVLRSAPEVRVLATSRQPLAIPGEQTVAVPPLSLPCQQDGIRSVKELTQAEAVRLFTERARAVIPSFAVTDGNGEVVCGIVRRLDGLPLAIELAAVRLRALSPRQLLDRLDDRFRLLNGGSKAVLPRHRTLQALIDWSYALCSDKERLLWQRASVFAGCLDLEAAEAVCCGDGIAREEVIDLVIGLVDKSVLMREDLCEGVVRYRMLDTVRAFGWERVESDRGREALRARHGGYYRRLAARARANMFGPEQLVWFRRLQGEHTNLRAALEWSFTTAGQGRDGVLLATDLLYHWITSYYLAEGRYWLGRALESQAGQPADRGRALWAATWLALLQGDVQAAYALLEEGHRLAERLEDEPLLAYMRMYSGMVAMWDGRSGEAIARYRQALPRFRSMGDPVPLALGLLRLALAHSNQGEAEQAVAAAEEGLALCEAGQDRWHRSYTMMVLGIELWRQGDLERATELERRSLDVNRSLGDVLGEAITIEVLAWIAGSRRQYQRAARLLGVVTGVWGMVGAPLSGYGHLAEYHDACVRRAREALGCAAYEAALRRGAGMERGEAVAYALREGRAAPRGGAADSGAGPLTRREAQIARLVAQGMTNKEIAASLVIAQRTAEGHIEHILTKLGFTSRAQIAVWVGEQGRAGAGPDSGDSGDSGDAVEERRAGGAVS